MKRFLTIGMLAACCLFAGCDKEEEADDDIIWDFATFSVGFYVQDAATGADLLDPACESNILGQPIAVTYDGKRYEPDPSQATDFFMHKSFLTRFLMPAPLALRLHRLYTLKEENGKTTKNYLGYRLDFGEFTPCDDWHDQEFTIEWGDGTSNTVRFDCCIVWRSRTDPDVLHPIWFDGKQQSDWSITLRK